MPSISSIWNWAASRSVPQSQPQTQEISEKSSEKNIEAFDRTVDDLDVTAFEKLDAFPPSNDNVTLGSLKRRDSAIAMDDTDIEYQEKIELDIKERQERLQAHDDAELKLGNALSRKQTIGEELSKRNKELECKFKHLIESRSEQVSDFIGKVTKFRKNYIDNLINLNVELNSEIGTKKFRFLNFFKFLGISKIFNFEQKKVSLENKIQEEKDKYDQLIKDCFLVEEIKITKFKEILTKEILSAYTKKTSFNQDHKYEDENQAFKSSLELLDDYTIKKFLSEISLKEEVSQQKRKKFDDELINWTKEVRNVESKFKQKYTEIKDATINSTTDEINRSVAKELEDAELLFQEKQLTEEEEQRLKKELSQLKGSLEKLLPYEVLVLNLA